MTSVLRPVLVLVLVLVGVLVLGDGAACRRPSSDAPPPSVANNAPAAVEAPPSVPPSAAATVAPPDDDLVVEAPENNPTSETVTIKLVADQARKARVFWGRKDLGLAPLELQRPRGSGPLDLVVVAPGALTLHTRVYTDRDDKLALRLYAESDGPSLLGYHAPAPEAAKSDAGAKRNHAGR